MGAGGYETFKTMKKTQVKMGYISHLKWRNTNTYLCFLLQRIYFAVLKCLFFGLQSFPWSGKKLQDSDTINL